MAHILTNFQIYLHSCPKRSEYRDVHSVERILALDAL